MTHISQMEPMIPAQRADLEALSLEVYKASARIAGRVHPITAKRIVKLLRNVNSYYSNRIEGIRTTLLDIESSLKGFSDNHTTRKLQLLHKQNIFAQSAVEEYLAGKGDITSSEFLCHAHKLLFDGVPEEFLIQRDRHGVREIVMIPGQLRDGLVRVGQHVPPDWRSLPAFLQRFQNVYSQANVQGIVSLVYAAAAHYRLLWIHPFFEGNGRVARLFSDMYLKCAGLEGYGLWTLSRGLARAENDYKDFLSSADVPRQGDYDGRDNLSERGLHQFCKFFLETALDQARFMDDLLTLDATTRNITLFCSLRTQGYMAGKKPLPKEAVKILTHIFVHGKLIKGQVHDLINSSDRKARDVVKSLLNEGLLETENQKAPLTIGLPTHAVQFYFPELCDPGAFMLEL